MWFCVPGIFYYFGVGSVFWVWFGLVWFLSSGPCCRHHYCLLPFAAPVITLCIPCRFLLSGGGGGAHSEAGVEAVPAAVDEVRTELLRAGESAPLKVSACSLSRVTPSRAPMGCCSLYARRLLRLYYMLIIVQRPNTRWSRYIPASASSVSAKQYTSRIVLHPSRTSLCIVGVVVRTLFFAPPTSSGRCCIIVYFGAAHMTPNRQTRPTIRVEQHLSPPIGPNSCRTPKALPVLIPTR